MSGTAKKKNILIKIGGRAAEQEEVLDDLLQEISSLAGAGPAPASAGAPRPTESSGAPRSAGSGPGSGPGSGTDAGSGPGVVLFHGGGAEVSRLSGLLGQEPVFKDGIRMTSSEEMDTVDMVLRGKMNAYIVRRCAAAGLNAVGLSGIDGSLFTGASIDPSGESRTGRVVSAKPDLLAGLLEKGYLPVVSSVSRDSQFKPLNINADEAALHTAMALKADILIFLSDIPGILDENKEVIRRLTPSRAETEITAGIIQGGMIPKVRSSISALAGGVSEVVVGSYTKSGDLASLLEGTSGSSIIKEDDHVE
ncbi:MAG: acetylglutamate kinase [Spirochaetales bacterium]|nr:acetylglutamate kinase [Spirochaetales bacterium]MCF7938104.1 acetylglutamate kinase [Spirochaetales bacterium]